jgi:hypothetical protein
MPGRPRKWVRARPPIRDLIEVVAMKGASLIPRWGISLDFVPHVQGDAIRWHRSDKSAIADIVYDPVDFDPIGGAIGPSSQIDPSSRCAEKLPAFWQGPFSRPSHGV